MGQLIDGVWDERWLLPSDPAAMALLHGDSRFRSWIRRGDPELPPVAGRYQLYVSHACPWAHRTLLYRSLEGLEATIGVTTVHPEMLADGWEFKAPHEDDVNGARYLRDLYLRTDAAYTGRVTVPLLWDRQQGRIVNNESADIIRMFDEELGAGREPDLRPVPLRSEIDTVNARVFAHVNTGVYKAGFAQTQEDYEAAVDQLFETLDWLEARLEGRRYLVGDRLTEADLRLFPTLVRFDPVYHLHFKCSRRRLVDYPNLWSLTRRIYALPGVKETVRIDEARRHYFYSHVTINPSRIVAVAPEDGLD